MAEDEVEATAEEAQELEEAFNQMRRNSDRKRENFRKNTYSPPQALPMPIEPGWVFHWIRKSSYGYLDGRNMAKRAREGFELCDPKEYPDYAKLSESKEYIEVGGLVLGKVPEELKADRDDYYARKSRNQVEAVDSNYFSLNDRGVETFKDPGTGVTFSGGRRR